MSRFPVCRYNKDQSRTKLKLDNLRFYKLFLFEGFKIYLKMAANGVLKMTYLSMRGMPITFNSHGWFCKRYTRIVYKFLTVLYEIRLEKHE